MLAAEKELPTREGEYWSKELKTISMSIKYYRMLLKWCNGTTIDKKELNRIGHIANIGHKPTKTKEVLNLLWKE